MKKILLPLGVLLLLSSKRGKPVNLPGSPAPLSQEGFIYPMWDSVSIARLKGLHPRVASMASELVYRAEKELGIRLRIFSALRSFPQQAALYAQGRTAPGNIVTNAQPGQSYHNFGLAVDVVEIRNGVAIWSNANWAKIGALGKRIGFQWGGDWTSFKDYPHFQTGLGYTLAWWRSRYPQGVTSQTFATVSGIAGGSLKKAIGSSQKIQVDGKSYQVEVSPWFMPYRKTERGFTRTNFSLYADSECGIYLIRSKASGKILYVGYSTTHLKKTLYRHFQSWEDPEQYRASYTDRSRYEVMIISTPCEIAKALELQYIDLYQPRDNHLKYKGGHRASLSRLPKTDFNFSDPSAENFVPF